MDNITYLDIRVNGVTRDATDRFRFGNIPTTYDHGEAKATVPTEYNSLNVTFNKLVDLNAFKIDGQDLPDEISILVRGFDENGDEHTTILNLTRNEFVFGDFPAVKKVIIIFVFSSEPAFILRTDMFGCLVPGMVI